MATEPNEGGTPAPSPDNEPAPTLTSRGEGGSPQPAPTLSKDSLPEPYRDDPTIAPHIGQDGNLDLQGLLKSYKNAESLIGSGDRLTLPKEDAPKEEWDKVFDRLGRPEKPESYEFETDERFQNVEVSEAFLGEFKQTAHQLGLTRTQANELYKWYMSSNASRMEEAQSQLQGAQEQSLKALRQEYGNALDKKLEIGRQALSQFGDDNLRELLDSSGMGSHPDLIRFVVRVGEAMSEDTLGPAIRGHSRFGMTPDAARREIADLQNDPAFMDPMNPKHSEVVERIRELTEAAYPTQDR